MINNKPKSSSVEVSIIIPVYNLASTLPETLNSCLEQTFTNFELLIIDDGSTDETQEIIRRYQEANPCIITIHQSHGGTACARNRGLQVARGTFIAFQDADDVWFPNKLQEQMTYLRQHPAVDLVFTNHRYLEANGISTDTRRERIGLVDRPSLIDLVIGRPVALSTVVAKREKILQTGGFKENLEACEDYDLWYRMLCTGTVFNLLDRVLALIRLRPNSVSSNLELYRRSMSRVWNGLLEDRYLHPHERRAVEKELATLPDCEMDADEFRGRYGEC